MKTRVWFRWVPAIAWMAVIFAFSQHHNIKTGLSCDFTLKKCAHLIEYGLLGLSFWVALTDSFESKSWKPVQTAWAYATLYAVTDEFHQWFIPTRTASPRDVVLDSIGAATLLLLYRFILHVQHHIRK